MVCQARIHVNMRAGGEGETDLQTCLQCTGLYIFIPSLIHVPTEYWPFQEFVYHFNSCIPSSGISASRDDHVLCDIKDRSLVNHLYKLWTPAAITELWE